MGAIIRNNFGELVAAEGRIGLRLSPLAAELFSIKMALELAAERRLYSLVIESDCMAAVRMINGMDE